MKQIFKLLLAFLLAFFAVLCWNIKSDIPIEELKNKYANEDSKFIEINGLNVHYRDEGEGETIVLLHGTASSLHTWDQWTTDLKNSYRVIRLDLPAFGLTGTNDQFDYQIESYSKFLETFLNKVQVDSMYLAGNSLGGEIAWNYTAKHSDQVQKLILLDPAGFSFGKKLPFVFKLARIPILNSLIRYVTPRSFIEKNIKEVYFDESKITDEIVDTYYDICLREGNRQAFIDRAKLDRTDHTSKLKNIITPTLVLWGKEDIWIPLSHADHFMKALPNSELAVMEKTGHVPMEENPKESLQIALDFIEK